MPYLLITTNTGIPAESQNRLLSAASKLLAGELGKPEAYVMAAIAPEHRMIFAGNEEAAAFLHLKSIGLPQTSLKSLSTALGQLLSEHCSIPSNRVYIEFTDVKGAFWGFDGNTFG